MNAVWGVFRSVCNRDVRGLENIFGESGGEGLPPATDSLDRFSRHGVQTIAGCLWTNALVPQVQGRETP